MKVLLSEDMIKPVLYRNAANKTITLTAVINATRSVWLIPTPLSLEDKEIAVGHKD